MLGQGRAFVRGSGPPSWERAGADTHPGANHAGPGHHAGLETVPGRDTVPGSAPCGALRRAGLCAVPGSAPCAGLCTVCRALHRAGPDTTRDTPCGATLLVSVGGGTDNVSARAARSGSDPSAAASERGPRP